MNDSNVSSAHFWEQCYQENNTGWDLGAPTPIFMNWCDNLELLSKICIPGAGNGYDPLYFASKGHDVTAIDFAESPISRLKKQSKDKKINLTALKNDIFNLEESAPEIDLTLKPFTKTSPCWVLAFVGDKFLDLFTTSLTASAFPCS